MTSIRKSFKGRDFLTLQDFTSDEVKTFIDVAMELKAMLKKGEPHQYLKGKTLGLIFQKSSTRTRVSFEVGMYQLGGYPLFLSSNDLQMGRGETIADTARTLSRYLDGIMIRTYAQSDVEELAQYADIPIINGLTDLVHPTQVIADLQTVLEHKGQLAGLKMAFLGDGNNVANSLMHGCAKVGMNISIASPPGYKPPEEIVAEARAAAETTGSVIEITEDPVAAVTGADVIYTDVWASMGQEQEQEERAKVLSAYQVNAEMVLHAKPDYIFLHCLPAKRGQEVTAEIIDGPHSVVFDEAENRLHAHKAIMALVMQD
ncbi:ornithine carbamoyltransferase [Desulfolucanica intricata]|uniref:ornithine carbamoyltransferase n=1 Tax=Desulfolucanica intricata TaxID=1285191 RepID=UPI00082DCE97|nr:ornithine carbamoyltransferase [Desulfolucanica intricata]